MFMAFFNWLADRLRDLCMWPINLVRDFPVRALRLLRLLWRGLLGLVTFLPDLIQADPRGAWLRWKGGRLADWLHQFLIGLFDLVGGPEIGEFLLHLFATTSPLTSTEISMMGDIVGESGMRFGDVRVVQGGLFDLIFKLNGNLAFATWHSINIPRTGYHTRDNLPLIIHELTHVFQYEQVGTRYLGEAIYVLVKTQRDCYNYGGREGLAKACGDLGRGYASFNREQQATITQDYCAHRLKQLDTTHFDPILAQIRAGQL